MPVNTAAQSNGGTATGRVHARTSPRAESRRTLARTARANRPAPPYARPLATRVGTRAPRSARPAQSSTMPASSLPRRDYGGDTGASSVSRASRLTQVGTREPVGLSRGRRLFDVDLNRSALINDECVLSLTAIRVRSYAPRPSLLLATSRATTIADRFPAEPPVTTQPPALCGIPTTFRDTAAAPGSRAIAPAASSQDALQRGAETPFDSIAAIGRPRPVMNEEDAGCVRSEITAGAVGRVDRSTCRDHVPCALIIPEKRLASTFVPFRRSGPREPGLSCTARACSRDQSASCASYVCIPLARRRA